MHRGGLGWLAGGAGGPCPWASRGHVAVCCRLINALGDAERIVQICAEDEGPKAERVNRTTRTLRWRLPTLHGTCFECRGGSRIQGSEFGVIVHRTQVKRLKKGFLLQGGMICLCLLQCGSEMHLHQLGWCRSSKPVAIWGFRSYGFVHAEFT